MWRAAIVRIPTSFVASRVALGSGARALEIEIFVSRWPKEVIGLPDTASHGDRRSIGGRCSRSPNMGREHVRAPIVPGRSGRAR